MIQYDQDGNTLFYIDPNGNRVSAFPTDTTHYSEMLKVRDAQTQALRENEAAVTNYTAKLSAVQGTYDMGRAGQNPDVPTTAPPKPLQKIVSDTGVVSTIPFVPALADLVIPKG